jgi:tetratricopeptide (TPR) repeat protein
MTDDVWLNRIEGILYFETDPNLTDELILAFGKALRSSFHKHVGLYAESIRLVDKKELYETHADFLSRLGMTFSHGDYARPHKIDAPLSIAEKLNKKALQFHKDHRAFLGLGMLYQQQGKFEDAKTIVEQGLSEFPDSFDLALCQAVNHMNIGDFQTALELLQPHQGRPEAKTYIDHCLKALSSQSKEDPIRQDLPL